MGEAVTYDRRIFDVSDLAEAKRVILTPEEGVGTDERWAIETPYLVDLIAVQIGVREGGLFVDYGCGVGRLAKPLVERFGCRILGVDLSAKMRSLASDYCPSQLFSVVSPQMLLTLVQGGLRVDGGLAVWSLQHSLAPAPEIAVLAAALKPDAKLFVANLNARAVPTAEGLWANDGIDVQALLAAQLPRFAVGKLDPNVVSERTSARTWCGVFSKP